MLVTISNWTLKWKHFSVIFWQKWNLEFLPENLSSISLFFFSGANFGTRILGNLFWVAKPFSRVDLALYKTIKIRVRWQLKHQFVTRLFCATLITVPELVYIPRGHKSILEFWAAKKNWWIDLCSIFISITPISKNRINK